MKKITFFSAAYRDGRVRIANKTYHAGAFANALLNKYYENETGARLAVFRMANWRLAEQLRTGYISDSLFIKAGEEIGHILSALRHLPPFDRLDLIGERERINRLFTEDNARNIHEYYNTKAAVMAMDENVSALDLLPVGYDKDYFAEMEQLLDIINDTLYFYDNLGDDAQNAFQQLTEFVDRLDEVERYDEAHLLPLALEIFGKQDFSVNTEYTAFRKSPKSKVIYTARKLYFTNYYGFVLTDFFEGLHYGHYPRQCPVCERYFLMTCARRQIYCNGYAPFKVKGKSITCRKYAARIKAKEYADGDPITYIYKNRCSAIRTEKSRGTITEDFAQAALKLAKELMQRARFDDEYARTLYKKEMTKTALYQETDRRLRS